MTTPAAFSRNPAQAQPRAWRLPAAFVVAVVVVGIVLSATVVPGVFTTDDNNYLVNVLALRSGRLTLPLPDGVSPSRELLFFDPVPWSRSTPHTSLSSTAPPLYALIALPFSVFGWRGLVALNTIAYLVTVVIVFVYARHFSQERSTPWLAATMFAVCGFSLEYAQGLWPHSLSVALCAGGVVAAGTSLERPQVRFAALAGFLLALATGVRYQNAVVLGAVGGGLALWNGRRVSVPGAFGLSAAIPLAVSSVLNHARHGSWNPISKGGGYLRAAVQSDSGGTALLEPLQMLWGRLVDYSVRPPLTSRAFEDWLTYDPATGAHLILGVWLKKSFLQSAPWAVLALLLFVLAWMPWANVRPRRRQFRLLSLVASAVAFAFSLAGAGRDDGLAFNQRYLLELVPLAAVAAAWALDDATLRLRPILIGAAAGIVLVVGILVGTPIVRGSDPDLWHVRHLALMKLPLALAIALAGTWILAVRTAIAVFKPALAVCLGVCLGWAFTLHAADDVFASHWYRRANLMRTQALEALLPNNSAYVAHWGYKDAAVPLLFDRNIVIVDLRADDGHDAPLLIQQLLESGRRVFLNEEGVPTALLHRIKSTVIVDPHSRAGFQLLELRLRAA